MTRITFLIFGGVLCLLAVALGAFGAHILKDRISPYEMDIFNKAVFYQVFHALAMILFQVLEKGGEHRPLKMASALIGSGILLFSGSLYFLSLSTFLQIPFGKVLGPVTPIGGLCFMAGWIIFVFRIRKISV